MAGIEEIIEKYKAEENSAVGMEKLRVYHKFQKELRIALIYSMEFKDRIDVLLLEKYPS